ncbi:hypothetical protein ANCCEY_08474 [Ancylostoma ceylanicum]|uniref:SCP domain-containing protein n=1 Tax=Ancylostoma ceylanicum TaxID=53326 RepID=A0A0D6LQZ4_9BILA|nr:hypothetical protein ANCCEY_08474 [Ancylostoma ceylanicum]
MLENKALQIYDCDLEAGAQQHASECSLKVSNSSSRKDIGENTRVVVGASRSPVYAAEKALKEWWSEMPANGLNPEMIFTEEMSHHKYNTSRHFAQASMRPSTMIWAKSHRLGCGMQKCEGKMFIVCRYAERDIQLFDIGSNRLFATFEGGTGRQTLL